MHFARRGGLAAFTAGSTLARHRPARLYSHQHSLTQPSSQTANLCGALREMVRSEESNALTMANQHYIQGGKLVRPTIVLLLSQCLNQHLVQSPKDLANAVTDRDMARTAAPPSSKDLQAGLDAEGVLPLQRRLAEITELIHTASLMHDDIIDGATTRRGMPSANVRFSNKIAVLSGDYLLAQASLELARLGSLPVIELLAMVIKHLVEGECMQMQANAEERVDFAYYLRKTHLKTASLIAKSCKAAAVLARANDHVQTRCYEFGKHLGIAFQLIDDMLDFVSSAEELGKPASGSDLRDGIITAPVLFAMAEKPQLRELVTRQLASASFRQDKSDEAADNANLGDIAERQREEECFSTALRMVMESGGLEQTQALAQGHISKAVEAISLFAPSEAASALTALAHSVTTRKR